MTIKEALSHVVCAIKQHTEHEKIEFEWRKSHSEFATKQDLVKMENRIMESITKFADSQNKVNTRLEAAIDGLQADVKSLNDTIAKLQATPDGWTDQDQTTLNNLQTRTEAVATKLEALDALTLTTGVPVPSGGSESMGGGQAGPQTALGVLGQQVPVTPQGPGQPTVQVPGTGRRDSGRVT